MGYNGPMRRIQYFIQNPLQLLYLLPALLLGLTLHEWGHAYAAYRCGDPTARNLGRMSLNPLDHFDILGTLCLLFLGFGWAKPVPVNPRNFKNFKRDDIIVSLAGVFMNLLQVVFFSALFILLVRWDNRLFFNDAFYYIFLNLIGINTTLIIFNLIPIPPLDGSHVAENLALPGLGLPPPVRPLYPLGPAVAGDTGLPHLLGPQLGLRPHWQAPGGVDGRVSGTHPGFRRTPRSASASH